MLAKLGSHLQRNAVAYLALFVAMGGTSFAAASVITGSDVKNSSLTGKDVKDESLTPRDFNGSVQGQRGDTGPQGPKGVPGVAGAKGQDGADGADGEDFTLATRLPSGQTETGIYSAWGGGELNYVEDSVNFRIPLSAAIPAANVHYDDDGGADPHASCPGTALAPAADPGHLCLYESNRGNVTYESIFRPDTGEDGAAALGFSIYFTAGAGESGDASAWSYGTWAVTAP